MFKNILIPTDGSALSENTVTRAITFAKEIGAQLTFFYAQPDFPLQMFGEGALIDPNSPEQFAKAAEQEAKLILETALAQAKAHGVSAKIDTLVSDTPYQAIIDAAARHSCDLIFMASHGRKGLASLLLGSETQKVLTHSTIPVLVYR